MTHLQKILTIRKLFTKPLSKDFKTKKGVKLKEKYRSTKYLETFTFLHTILEKPTKSYTTVTIE